MGAVCGWCGGEFPSAGPGPKWGHDTTLCLHNQFAGKTRRVALLEDALRKALKIIDERAWVDDCGMRPSNHPAVDDMRELLNPSP